MKTKFFISALVVASLLAFNHSFAFFGDDEGESHEHDCEIDGNETLHASVLLVATTNAPAGAAGIAKLEAEIEDGVLTNELEIKTVGLPAGDYVLTAVRKSDASEVLLGTITLNCSDDEDEDEDNEVEDEDHEGEISHRDGAFHDEDDGEDEDGDEDGDHHDGECGCDEAVLRSESEVTLPADLDPMDIGQIILSDAAGIPLLIGDFVNPAPGTTIKFKACVRLAPDESAPACQGTAQVLSTVKKGKHKNRFTMVASGVPANTTFNVQVNGNSVGSAKSNKKGKVLVKKLKANHLNINSVQLMDSQGRAAARAKF